ncbi:OmpA family protein [Flavobacterium sp.]|uniref:OmpA family protein n=1 Tax=Flavobacterium sp. TaxID=239 RepID=UPI00286EA427|nr:OmpA family protein [Flavobacterium sp.]
MSKRTLYFLGILATIVIGTYLYYKYCCKDCCKEQTEKTVQILTDNTGMGDYNIFNLSGNDFNYTCHDNFRFLSNNFKNIQPINDSINVGIEQLKSYFDKNATEKLVITGYALNTEKNTSAYPNLGIARANDVKNYFVSKGFTANRFETLGELRDVWKVENDTVLGAVDFRIKQGEEVATEKPEDWNALKAKINANPLILYFNTNQSEINLTPKERQKIADLSTYLDNVPEAKISCVGHTDGTGNRDTNIQLGQGRADFAKEYLSKNGIISDRIESSSKGPDEPIAANNTAEGKAKNRRTVVNLK